MYLLTAIRIIQVLANCERVNVPTLCLDADGIPISCRRSPG